jgi:outer membrane protein assembly factor BamB
MLESGNLLIYDNGVRNRMTRIIELDPASGEIVWSYPSPPRRDFYSMRRGSNQRLPNGNTLIAESEKGHVIEVTPEGDIVWEFWNPELMGKRRKRIYRFMRMAEGELRNLVRSAR